ncbi:MAG: hypothetical protein ACE5JQ_15585 [Candidatus Methylomirabilales bacterium]
MDAEKAKVLFDLAEKLVRMRAELVGHAEEVALTVGVAKRKAQLGELSFFEREYVGEGGNDHLWANLIMCRIEDRGDALLTAFLHSLARDETQRSRSNLVGGTVKELMLPAVNAHGMDLALDIVRSIEEYDERFKRAAALVVSGS